MVSELFHRNVVVIGDRLHWPVGAVGAVLELSADFPGWGVTWSRGGLSRWREAGFYAWPRDHRMRGVFMREDPAEIREVLEGTPEPDWTAGWAPPGGWLVV